MVIAVDTLMLEEDEKDNFASFVYFCILQLAKESPKNQFIFFSDEIKETSTTTLPANVSLIVVSPKVSNRLSLIWWYDVKLPSALKKYKAELLICASFTCSLRTIIPQIFILNDFHSLTQKKWGKIYFSKYRLSKSIKAASIICTLTHYSKEEYCTLFKLKNEKTIVTSIANHKINTPILWDEKEEVKEKYTAGYEYFICTNIEDGQFIPLLKAFSIFKKWQKSNMKLVFTNISMQEKKLDQTIATYKHRNELFFHKNRSKEEYNLLSRSAYAAIIFSGHQLFYLLQSMQSEVPLIAFGNGHIQEIADDSALYFESINSEQIADKMKAIYKDEQLRNQLIAKEKKRAETFTTEKVLKMLQQAIKNALE